MELTARKYPVGIQTFSEIIKQGYLYIDKTDLVWNLANYAKFLFLSRPRRFGKSLLTSTLAAYFAGDKQLFAGLKIMQLEHEWKPYPVIHIDLSEAKGRGNAQDLRQALLWLLSPLAEQYGREANEETPGQLLTGIMRRAAKQTGTQVVVLIDEYDGPLLDVLHQPEPLDAMRRVMQEFFQPLKANEAIVKFCFLTGITKLSQLSIFSTLNNLLNVTMLPRFAAICGITEQELATQLAPDIEALARTYDCTVQAMHGRLKMRYDGYHFTEKSPDIYNPYSLLSTFKNQRIANYWFASGTPTFLIQMMRRFHFNITQIDGIETTEADIDRPTEAMTSMIPLLYQTGYLTITGYDRESEIYTLSIPNQEVRIGYTDGLLPVYAGLEGSDVQTGFAFKFWRALKAGDIDQAMRHMQAYLAGIPYVEGFKRKLAEAATREGFYEYTFYLIFSMLNVYVRTQVRVAGGRADVVVHMPDAVYVLELKVGGTAREALEQIDQKGYARPYMSEGRRVVCVGVNIDPDTRTVVDWETREELGMGN